VRAEFEVGWNRSNQFRTVMFITVTAILTKPQTLVVSHIPYEALTILASVLGSVLVCASDILAVCIHIKLYVPISHFSAVVRPRLIDRLNAGTHGKLTLISAPAGFGKTTLITAWVALSSTIRYVAGRSFKRDLTCSHR